jgi:hypothetical protein
LKRPSLQHYVYQSARLGVCILGMQAYLDWFPGDRAIQGARNILANRLLDIYERSHSPKRGSGLRRVFPTRMQGLSQALILAGWRSDNQRMIEAGMDSLKWLVAEQHRDDKEIFVPIGSNGFLLKGMKRRASISSQWRHAQPFPPALRCTG